jgi:hypothetical protein
LTPSTGQFSVNDQVVVAIRENSLSVAVNSIQANLTYPAGKLQFVSASTAGSPFTTTVQNTGGSGNVQLAVGLLGGSVSGDQLVGTVTFKALASGTAQVDFTSDSGIADEATSSNVCQQKEGGLYVIS